MKAKHLENLRVLCEGMRGHNYELPDCITYVFERMGRTDLGFWDIAAITGDTVAHVYNTGYTTYCGYCTSGFLGGEQYIRSVFDMLGYSIDYAPYEQMISKKAEYMEKIVRFIDHGIPVIVKTGLLEFFPKRWEPKNNYDVLTYCLIVGYEINGDEISLKLLTADSTELTCTLGDGKQMDLIIVEEKVQELTLKDILLTAIKNTPKWLTYQNCGSMYFGTHALNAWAEDIRHGKFAKEYTDFDWWGNWGVYVCNIATSGGQIATQLHKVSLLDDQYSFLTDVALQVDQLYPTEDSFGAGKCRLWGELEALGLGMDMRSVKENITNPKIREKAACILEDYANRFKKVAEIMEGII